MTPRAAGGTVVVLGAGIGGLVAAEELRRLVRDQDRILVVAREDRQVLGLSLPWIVRGWREPDEVAVRPSALTRRGIEFLEGKVRSIDVEKRHVTIDDETVSFDALLIALGAQRDPTRIAGLAEALKQKTAGHYYTFDGAVELRRRLRKLEGGRVCVVVSSLPFSCPAGPYEGALLLADLFEERGARAQTTIDLFTPEPLPLPVAGPTVGRALVGVLDQHGIAFHPSLELQEVDAARQELVFASGRREEYDFLVAVPPHRPPTPVAETGLGPQGWVPVDAHHLRTTLEGVWAIGDVTTIALANGRPLPKAGVFAQGQAKAAAADIARSLGYEVADEPFLGDGWCWVEVGSGEAAFARGNFYAEPNPEVTLHDISAARHLEREAEERAWIERFTT